MKKEKAKFSGNDSRGYLQVDCSECARGGNGNASCSAGGRIKKGMAGACFHGDLLDTLDLETIESGKKKKGSADEINENPEDI